MIKIVMPAESSATMMSDPQGETTVINSSDKADFGKERLGPEMQSTKTIVERMTGSLLNARIKDKKLGAEPGSVENKILSAQAFGNITKEQIGDGIKLPGHGDLEEGSKMQGEPVYVNIDGKKVLVAEIQNCDDDMVTVGFVDDDKPHVMSSEKVSRQAMHDAMLVSERKSIEDGFADDPDKQALVRSHMDTLAANIDPELQKPDYADELRDQAEKVAEEQGILTAKDMKGFIDHFPEDAKDSAEVQDLLARLDGKVLLDSGDITRVLKVGINPEQLGDKIIDMQEPINALKQEVERLGPDTPAGKIRKEELDALIGEQQVYAKLREQFTDGAYEKMEEYFDKVQNGEIDPEKGKKVIDAFRSGDMDGLFDSVPGLKMEESLTDEQKAVVKEKRKAILKKVGKGVGYTGLGLAALIALLAAAGIVMSASGMKSQN